MKARLDELTALRGIAACMVVLYHAISSWSPVFGLGQGYSMIIASGWLWVSFFFVLSGFVMMFAYGESLKRWNFKTYRRFVIARFGRIYPLFLFTMIVLLAAIALGWVARRDEWRTLLAHFLLIQGFTFAEPGWNAPAWSISTEWAVYLVFPLFVPMLTAFGRRATLACTFAFAFAIAWIFLADINSKAVPLERLVSCGLQFALGCSVYRMVREGWWPIFSLRFGTLLCMLPVILMGLPILLFTTTTTACIAVSFAVAIGVMARQETYLHRPLRHKWMQFLGRISYSIYLNHAIVYLLAMALVDELTGEREAMMRAPAWIAVPSFLVYMGTLILLSNLTYRQIEEPARMWFKDRSKAPASITRLSAS